MPRKTKTKLRREPCRIESTRGKSACFCVYVPLRRVHSAGIPRGYVTSFVSPHTPFFFLSLISGWCRVMQHVNRRLTKDRPVRLAVKVAAISDTISPWQTPQGMHGESVRFVWRRPPLLDLSSGVSNRFGRRGGVLRTSRPQRDQNSLWSVVVSDLPPSLSPHPISSDFVFQFASTRPVGSQASPAVAHNRDLAASRCSHHRASVHRAQLAQIYFFVHAFSFPRGELGSYARRMHD